MGAGVPAFHESDAGPRGDHAEAMAFDRLSAGENALGLVVAKGGYFSVVQSGIVTSGQFDSNSRIDEALTGCPSKSWSTVGFASASPTVAILPTEKQTVRRINAARPVAARIESHPSRQERKTSVTGCRAQPRNRTVKCVSF